MIDPLEIVNEFFKYNLEDPEWPNKTPFDDYWSKKICDLADRCVKAENALEAKSKRGRKPKTKCFLCEGTEAIDICRSCYNKQAVKNTVRKEELGAEFCDCMKELMIILRNNLEKNVRYDKCRETFNRLFEKICR